MYTHLFLGEGDKLGLVGVVLELLVPSLDAVTVLVEEGSKVSDKGIVHTHTIVYNVLLAYFV